MNVKRIEVFVIVVIIAIIGIIFAFRKPVLAPTTETPNQNQSIDQSTTGDVTIPTEPPALPPVQLVPNNVIQYTGVDGKNALELLKATHRVDATHYSFGDLVTGIDGVSPDSSHFWAMYVNGQFSQVGASAYITKSSDTIRWQIDEVK